MATSLQVLIASVYLYFGLCDAQATLGRYNVDRNTISVSGVSSGAAMATQMHVAYSSVFMGAAILAGNPYYCAQGGLTQALICGEAPERVPVNELVSQTTTWASAGEIDATNNMYNDKIFVFNGALDTTVNPGMGQKVMQYYYSFVRSENIKGVFDIQAAHTVPTPDYGNACSVTRSPFISKCNYDFAYESLNYIYDGTLQRPENPSGALPGQFIEFNQKEFIPNFASFGNTGYIYVPTRCVSGAIACKLHVAIHGCRQGNDFIGDEFARRAGYNYVAELNDIIILYPNVVQSVVTPVNPQGCWDWWGYTNDNYAIKKGPQMNAVYKMVARVAL